MTVQDIARVCHESIRAFNTCLGDRSQPEWDLAPEWQRRSSVDGVRFHIANPTADARETHNNWMREKVDNGWKYGPRKDEKLKEHPCIVPFDQLPIFERIKDELFLSVVNALKSALG